MPSYLSKSSLSNLKHSVISQLLVVIFGIVRAIIIPIYLGVVDFGFWQIYLLYVGFVGVLSFGFNDGIYLRYGGKTKDELPWELLRGSFVVYLFTLLIISVVFFMLLDGSNIDENKGLSLIYVIFNITLVGLSSLFLFVFQTTNQIKKYSIYLLVDKIIFIVFLVFFLLSSSVNFELLMMLDCGSKFLLAIAMLVDCRKDFFGKIASIKGSCFEYLHNINVGSKLMVANLAGMVVLNISRFILERYYTVEQFSTYSFGITLTNIVLMAVGGVSVVIYPVLKRLPEEKYKQIYRELTDVVTLFSFLSLLAYFPIYLFVLKVMPAYSPVLVYFNILFVLMLFQIKMQLLTDTFYKTLRKEKDMLKANTVCVGLVLFLSVLVIFFHKSVLLMALALLIAVIYRVYRSDFFLQKIFKSCDHNAMLLELSVFSTFLIITTITPIQISFSITFLFSAFILFNKRKRIKYWFAMVKGN